MVSFKAPLAAVALLGFSQHSSAAFLPPIIAAVGSAMAGASGVSAATWIAAAGGVASGAAAAADSIRDAKKGDKRRRRYTREALSVRSPQEMYGAKLAWDLCRDDVKKATLGFEAAGPGNILVTGLPPTCMVLATTITGTFNEGTPVPMGTDSIQFNNVSDETIDAMEQALRLRND
ncbi:hypothetical protein BDZ85DRAFT_279047 [Elsinoe ampelina]|uniref:Uncharacterized protein n=1 Tax=Elsinoe ampelina TaxID=302913 RepID=A0A6A6GP54_9PEZI|nr:hypothetical protein BDZ85DRAFT_279047 [Elsinoe ampelina]